MKSEGQITYWLSIPVTIDYHVEEPDKTAQFLIGKSHIIVDMINYADDDEITGLVGKDAEKIKRACEEDLE